MREIRLYGSEGGGAVCSPYPYQSTCHDNPQGLLPLPPLLRGNWVLSSNYAQGAPRLKFTVTCVTTSTGCPFSSVGRYLHC